MMRIAVDIARVILGLYFLYNGLNHLRNLKAMAEYARSKKVPSAEFLVALTGLMLLAGGISILSGYLVPWGIALLAIFLVPTAFIMHNFWAEQDPMAKANQMAHFLKNIALAAAVTMLAASPSWTW
jgi:putative oxidoreductase